MNTRAMTMGFTGLPMAGRVLLATLCLALGMLQSGSADAADPAGRVARISYLKGRVFVQPAAADAWTEARINRPLTSGDQLWTEAYSRSELQIGSASLQIDANTQLRLLELSDEVLQLEVAQGTVSLHARQLERNATVEIDTPNAAISVLELGTYRVEVAADSDLTLIQVRDGSVEAVGERQSFNLRDGEQLRLQGLSRLSADYEDLPRMDDFDRWASERNQRSERSTATRYVASDVIGHEDLDDYGYWRWYQGYGNVWMPSRIATGWAPYRYGHWTWIAPWGWTWVDDAPWGFAPFHYGRWTQISNRWCWVPGPRSARAVYAPALVAWVGTPGVSLSVNLGSQPVGWIPLGPREVYRPYYAVSNNYALNININNSLLSRDEFDRGYRRQPHESSYGNRGAMSVVPANALASARPVDQHLQRNNDRLQAVDTVPARPELIGLLGGERRNTPSQVNSREVLARRQPGDSEGANNGGRGVVTAAPSRTPGETARSTGERSAIRVITPAAGRRSDNNTSGTVLRDTQPALRPVNSPSVRTPEQDVSRSSGTGAGPVAQPERSERSTISSPYIRQPGSTGRGTTESNSAARETGRSEMPTPAQASGQGSGELRSRSNDQGRNLGSAEGADYPGRQTTGRTLAPSVLATPPRNDSNVERTPARGLPQVSAPANPPAPPALPSRSETQGVLAPRVPRRETRDD